MDDCLYQRKPYDPSADCHCGFCSYAKNRIAAKGIIPQEIYDQFSNESIIPLNKQVVGLPVFTVSDHIHAFYYGKCVSCGISKQELLG